MFLLRVRFADTRSNALFDGEAKSIWLPFSINFLIRDAPRTGRYVLRHITPVMLRPYLCAMSQANHEQPLGRYWCNRT